MPAWMSSRKPFARCESEALTRLRGRPLSDKLRFGSLIGEMSFEARSSPSSSNTSMVEIIDHAGPRCATHAEGIYG